MKPDNAEEVKMKGQDDGHRKAASQAHSNSAGESGAKFSGEACLQAIADAIRKANRETAWPDPTENAGIRAGELIGYRAWRVVSYPDIRLESLYYRTLWPRVAQSGKPGFFAFKDAQHQLFQMARLLTSVWPTVVGKVALWGWVMEHEEGYRAEYAKVISIDEMFYPEEPKIAHVPPMGFLRKKLLEIYGV